MIVQVTVNDEPHTLDAGATLADLVAHLGLTATSSRSSTSWEAAERW
jgi:sulfur carrier protein ThiS